MNGLFRFRAMMLVFSVHLQFVANTACAAPSAQDAMDAMKKASDFMMSTVAYRGGFVEKYTQDLSERWGEVPARDTMIWVQDPGTVTVGRLFLKAYRFTHDPVFLDHAQKAGDALVDGQLECGGWHYFIDFDPAGTQAWYREVLEKAWGWEEFYHWSGNATFDDTTTAGATAFLMDLYTATQEPAYRATTLKALQLVLDAQYPLGGWPQRYPLSDDHRFEGRPDYTPYYTFNDDVIGGNIDLLLEAHRRLGDARYLDAARRGMYFTVIAQLGSPQAGWAQQYTMALEPAQARSFEPGGLAPNQTVQCIHDLMRYYTITGDRRFLRGIPDALDWLDRARLPVGHSDRYTHAQFVEVGTDRPLYAHREGTSVEDGRYWVDYEPGNYPGHYGMQVTIDVDALRREFVRVNALTPDEARAEFETPRATEVDPPTAAPETVAQTIDAMDARGAWIEDLDVVDYTDWKFKPRRSFRGISVPTFVRNMETLLAYWQQRHGG